MSAADILTLSDEENRKKHKGRTESSGGAVLKHGHGSIELKTNHNETAQLMKLTVGKPNDSKESTGIQRLKFKNI
jgi:hypothetical protein